MNKKLLVLLLFIFSICIVASIILMDKQLLNQNQAIAGMIISFIAIFKIASDLNND